MEHETSDKFLVKQHSRERQKKNLSSELSVRGLNFIQGSILANMHSIIIINFRDRRDYTGFFGARETNNGV